MSETDEAASRAQSPWRRFSSTRVAVGVLAVAILAPYADDWPRLIRRWWTDPNYTHGFLVQAYEARGMSDEATEHALAVDRMTSGLLE